MYPKLISLSKSIASKTQKAVLINLHVMLLIEFYCDVTVTLKNFSAVEEETRFTITYVRYFELHEKIFHVYT